MSKLEDYLSNELFTRFGQYSIRRNYFPDWLRTATGSKMQLRNKVFMQNEILEKREGYVIVGKP